jgi:hypothetical protein
MRAWQCPCGSDPPKHPGSPTPTLTLVSLREPRCPHCGRRYRPEYELELEQLDIDWAIREAEQDDEPEPEWGEPGEAPPPEAEPAEAE